MALPAHLLQQLSPELLEGLGGFSGAPGSGAPDEVGLGLGLMGIDALLPDGGLPHGAVTELAVLGGAALGTSLSLAACRAAQKEGLELGGQAPWCAFIDPSGTLYGPGVQQAGILLERLLIVRPAPEALSRVALRLAESHAFSVLVIDLVGAPGASVGISLGTWPRVVRRLSLAAQQSQSIVVLITDREARRPLPLPVALRLELERPSLDELSLRVAKERRGRVSSPRSIAWARPGSKALVRNAPAPAKPAGNA